MILAIHFPWDLDPRLKPADGGGTDTLVTRQEIEPFGAGAALSERWFGARDAHVTECGLAYHGRGSTFRSRFRGLDDARRRLCIGRAGRFAGLMMSQCDAAHIGARSTQLGLVGSLF